MRANKYFSKLAHKIATYLHNFEWLLVSMREERFQYYSTNVTALLAFSQKRSQCILGLFGGTKNTVVDVKYVRIEIYTIKYQLFT